MYVISAVTSSRTACVVQRAPPRSARPDDTQKLQRASAHVRSDHHAAPAPHDRSFAAMATARREPPDVLALTR